MTVPQVRQIFTRLLRDPPPSPEEIAAEVTRVLRRNEESRIYHWYAKHRDVPAATFARRYELNDLCRFLNRLQ